MITKQIRDYIRVNMYNDTLDEIFDYIYMYKREGDISQSQCASLCSWAEKFHELMQY